MAVTKIHKTSRIVMYITMAITIVVMTLFFLGGEVPVDQRLVPTAPEPKYIDLLMYWVYFLVGCTVLVLLAFAIADFSSSLKNQPKKAINSLLVIVAFAAMFVITYMLGSDKPLDIVGYTGPDNVPGRLKMTDMFMYSMYIMLALAVLAMIFSPLLKRKSNNK
jgi:magnesium-transporting ATPase (P-type)